MALYEITHDELKDLGATTFASERINERQDLQRLIRKKPSVLADGLDDLRGIAEEFCKWEDSKRRIDLLCIDADANLVVVELKRTEDGGFMDLQSVRYAAMVSQMTLDQAVDLYAKEHNKKEDVARTEIMEFLRFSEDDVSKFGGKTRIILASSDFSKELTTSVMWLNEQELDIRCVRMKPYKMTDGRVMLDIQQIIPLPEASAYQTQIREKQYIEKKQQAERHDLRLQFWTELLNYAATKTTLHQNKKPSIKHWVDTRIERRGFVLSYVVLKYKCQVELYIDITNSEEETLRAFRFLEQHKSEIESEFGGELLWEELNGKRACRISYAISQLGYRSPKNEWEEIHKKLVDFMVRLDKAVRPYVQRINTNANYPALEV